MLLSFEANEQMLEKEKCASFSCLFCERVLFCCGTTCAFMKGAASLRVWRPLGRTTATASLITEQHTPESLDRIEETAQFTVLFLVDHIEANKVQCCNASAVDDDAGAIS